MKYRIFKPFIAVLLFICLFSLSLFFIQAVQQAKASSENPVIVVPGFLGSATKSDSKTIQLPLLSSKKPMNQNDMVMYDTDLGPTGLNALVNNLNKQGIKAYGCPYDWRLTIEEIAKQYLKPKIEQVMKETGKSKVIIIAHSMGGLVSRYYIQNMSGTQKISALYMLGTPNEGVPNIYPVSELGLQSSDDYINGVFNLFTLSLTRDLFSLMSPEKRVTYLQKNLPALKQMNSTNPKLVKNTATNKYSNPINNKFLVDLNNKKYSSFYKPINATKQKKGVYAAVFCSNSIKNTVSGYKISSDPLSQPQAVMGKGDDTVPVESAAGSTVFSKSWTRYEGDYGAHVSLAKNEKLVKELLTLIRKGS